MFRFVLQRLNFVYFFSAFENPYSHINMSVTNNTITNYKTVTNSKLTLSCFVFHLKNAHIPLVSRTILVERMPGVKKKALLKRYFGKKIRISKMKISKYVIWAGYKHRATTGCATLKQGTTVLKMKIKIVRLTMMNFLQELLIYKL